jgi:hypothetical protein
MCFNARSGKHREDGRVVGASKGSEEAGGRRVEACRGRKSAQANGVGTNEAMVEGRGGICFVALTAGRKISKRERENNGRSGVKKTHIFC